MNHSAPILTASVDEAERAVVDTGRVRVGAGWRLLPAKPAATAPAEVADRGQIRIGAGWKLFAG